jgi:protein gp37
MDVEWARALCDQCKAAGIPFFMKQLGMKRPIPRDLLIRQFPAVSS